MHKILRWLVLTFITSLPYITLEIVYLSDSNEWNEILFGYGGIFIAAPIIFLGWIIFLVFEILWRRKFLTNIRTSPLFSLAGALALVVWLFHIDIVRPIVLSNPNWCRVSQHIVWTTSATPSPSTNHSKSYYLVYTGSGNRNHPDFSSAYLNWGGDEPAGFTHISLNPILFYYWKEYDQIKVSGTKENLSIRISNSGLPQEEIELLTSLIWESLTEAGQKNHIIASKGKLNALREYPEDKILALLGGIIWCIILLVTFGVISKLTLKKKIK